FDFTTYRATLNFNQDETTLWYGSVARGGKTGGFNNTPIVSEQAFDSEFNTTFEVGYKASPSDTLTYSVAAYLTDWSDVQLTNPSSVPGNPNVTQNIGDVGSYGVEIDGTWLPTEQFSVSFGYAYSDPTFEDGTEDFTHARRCTTAADCGLSEGPNGGIDIGGQTVDRISQHQFYLSPQYEWGTDSWDFFVRGDIAYQSEQFQRTLNLQTIEARTIVNGRIGMDNGKGLALALWVKNLTDENYFASAINEPEFLFDLANFTLFQSTFTTGLLANGRQFGASMTYSF
ncbi:MAG: TonB-dependent receptor, partial [Woeseiaceae bacterium]